MALTDKLTAIANAIRAKTGGSAPLTLPQMATEIGSLSAPFSVTNILTTAIDTDNSSFNGGLGYKSGYRLSGSGAEHAFADYSVSGYIPVSIGDVIRGTFTDEKGRKTDGLFSASMYPVSLYYVTTYYVYDTMYVTAPEGEFIEWEAPLMECLGSIEFTKKFVDGFMGQEEILGRSLRANAQIYNETSDLITKGWEARQSTYDILSQKRSDTTLGYERVYDTETNEIYRAYNGFTDDYKGDRYKTVTDNMYNLPVNGYIEKK